MKTTQEVFRLPSHPTPHLPPAQVSYSSMANPRPPPSKPLDLEITIVSAKHLKNVNWRHGGDLKPYSIFWIDPDRRLATKSDDSGSTRPVWNERFVLPLTLPPNDTILTLEVFHSKPQETPKPLVGTLRFPLKDLVDSDDSNKLRTFELRRPSGRPQGKIRLKLAFRERPGHYSTVPQTNYYFNNAPLPPPRDYRGYSAVPPPQPAPPSPAPSSQYSYGSYSDPYTTSYYPTAFPNLPAYAPASAPVPALRPQFERQSSYGGPSAPVDYAPPYDQKPRTGNTAGLGTGLAVGALAGAVGGIALDEGLRYEEEKIGASVARDIADRDDYGDFRDEY